MTWISIDPQQALLVGLKMLDNSLRGNTALDRLGTLSGTAGLGAFAALVERETAAARQGIVRHVQRWIDEGTDMLERTNRLLREQAATQMIGAVPSIGTMAFGGAAIVGGSALVGGAGAAAGATMTIGGGSTFSPAASATGGSMIIGGGVGFSSAVSSSQTGLSSVMIGGGGPSSNPLYSMAELIQSRREATTAKLDALRSSSSSASPTGQNANDIVVNGIMQAQANRTFMDVQSQMGAISSLTFAPSGSRITSSSGPSAGYETLGTYGSVRIESPIYEDRFGRPMP